MKPLITNAAFDSLTHKVFLAEQVRKKEPEAAVMAGCSMYELMRWAGSAAFEKLMELWPNTQHIGVMVGSGNNGGDGYILATHALRARLQVTVCSPVPDKKLSGDALRAQQAFFSAGGKLTALENVDFSACDVMVDALLGTGLKEHVKPEFATGIATINRMTCPVLSLDLPSGIHADTGVKLGVAVAADATITFVGIKRGLLTGIGKQCCGDLYFDDLTIGKEFVSMAEPGAQRIAFDDYSSLPARQDNAHKGHFGRLLIVGGNAGMGGAARMAGEVAMRCGTAMVKVYCHSKSMSAISSGRPEIMVSDKDLQEHLMWADTIVLGPGLGKDEWARKAFQEVIGQVNGRPTLIDADGLNLLAELEPKLSAADYVLTPHPGEAARLLKTETSRVEADRYTACQALSMKYKAAVVLKGAGTIIVSDKRTFVCRDGNPGMATAGMGDVLSGVIGGCMAQSISAEDSAIFGTCLHAAAGDIVAEKQGQRGMLASDLITPLRELINR